MKFRKAITRTPAPSMVNGLTTANLGQPNYKQALIQHQAYIDALKSCGLEVIVLPPDDQYPDSTFVEDTALLTPTCAIIMNPGAESRKGETKAIEAVLKDHFRIIEHVQAPGTADAGDIMMVGSHFYIGLSERTSLDGAKQIIQILEKYNMAGTVIPVEDSLHLKSDLAYLENNILMATSGFVKRTEFLKFKILEVAQDENYSANSLWVNDTVLVAEGFPKTKARLTQHDFKIITLKMSEFQKIDGGLSCLSLRF